MIRQGDRMFTFQAWPRVVNECDVKMPRREAAELHYLKGLKEFGRGITTLRTTAAAIAILIETPGTILRRS